ncbi:MAG: glycosyltransferase family 39 protein [Chloroflexota bacterium]
MHTPRLPQIASLTGILCLTLLALINGADSGSLATITHPLQFALFYAGLALIVWGFSGGRAGFAAYRQPVDDTPWTRREIALLAGIASFALGLRLWALETSIHSLVDELNPINEILAMWTNPTLKILQPLDIFTPYPRLMASWQAASTLLLGRNLTALRLPSAVLGTLTVIAVYMLGRTLFNRRTALIAALLLAVFPPHIHFSRLGLVNIADPLFGTLALAFFARGLRFGRNLDWVLGGAALGLTQYFYEGGRLLFPVVIVLWLALYMFRHRADFARLRRGLLIAGIVAALVAAPVYYTLAQMHSAAAERMNYMALTPAFWARVLVSPPNSPIFDLFVRHTADPLLIFINRAELSTYYGGDQPLILAYLLPALLLGALVSLRRGRLLILWFLAVWMGNFLLVDSAVSTRYLVVFPAIVLIMALGIDAVSARLPIALRRWLIPAYMVICSVGQITYYFGPHLDTFNQRIRLSIDTDDAIFRAAALPAGTQVYLLGSHVDRTADYAQSMLRYLADDIHLTFLPSLDGFNYAQPSHQSYAFLIPPDDSNSAQQLASHFALPAPQFTPYAVPRARTYTLYFFPTAP